MRELYGVIGDPIAHSMSPLMHNDAFKALHYDADYHAFHVTPDNLEVAVKGMKAIGVSGFNVTIPHKTAIIPYLDEIDPLAEAIGAVNTVVRKGTKWIGYNTDGPGFIQSLKEDWKEDVMNEHVLVVGAGGAAKAIYYALAQSGVKQIDICNRTLDKAIALQQANPFHCQSKAITLRDAEECLAQYSLIVQTTSIGMHPNVHLQPISLKHLNINAYVADIIYNPFETAFLNEAKRLGANIQNGLGMFIYQGAIAFEKWTGQTPNVKRMKQIVMDKLGGK